MTWSSHENGDRTPAIGLCSNGAAAEGRVLITMDKDFGEFLFVEKAVHCGMVRLPDVPAVQRIELMEKVLADHTQNLLEQAVITVRGGRIRISHP